MCSKLPPAGVPPRPLIRLKLSTTNQLQTLVRLAYKLHFPLCPLLWAWIGVPLVERDRRKRISRSQEAEHASHPDCAFPDFLRLDGPAGRGTGTHD